MAKKRSDTDPFKDLTWDDLQAWAGTSIVSRGRSYLRKIHHLFKTKGREKEWQPYLTELRQAHARKRRLLEILDSLSGRPIAEGA